MYEIEAKAPLSKADFSRLQKQLKKTAKFKGKSIKKDTYYDDTRKIYLRVREMDKKTLFEIKVKNIISGVESNIEIGWGIKDKKNWTKLLSKLDIRPTIQKTKKTEAYQLNGFNIELNYISGLGYFLEIERVVKSKKQIPKAKKELIDIFGNFGYSQKDFEKKYYLDLLQEHRKQNTGIS
jgi:adenylate cyclase class 2